MNILQAQSVRQRTLKNAISYVGRGLHSACRVTMTIKPAEVDHGIVFVRKDVHGVDNRIPARWCNTVDTRLSTVVGNQDDIRVATVEHLMAAIYGCGIDNALIEIDGPEVPIVDGSAEPFVSLFEQTGTVQQDQPRKALRIHRPIRIEDDDKFMILLPSNIPHITVDIDFPNTAIGRQSYSLNLVRKNFQRQIAHARTFGFKQDLETLRARGLARGGSMQNAILVDGDEILNEGGLRSENEFVRHKVLDVVGDFALLGMPIYGHLVAYRPGHALNNRLLHQLMSKPGSWSLTTVDEMNHQPGLIHEPHPSLPTAEDAPELDDARDTKPEADKAATA